MPGTFTCSEDEDFGSLGDFEVITINGTSGTPADNASFVTADRAGEAVLLAATAGLSGPDNTLTYAIRPVEDLALLISCIVASKTAEADFIFITGTDFAGNAQTESLDVTAGNGTYVTTKYFASISSLDCSDNAAGGGTQWADGTIRVTQAQWGFIWDYGNNQYKIDAVWEMGDGSTATYFTSLKEHVLISRKMSIKAQATLQLGELQGDHGINGSDWILDTPGGDSHWYWINVSNASLNIFASHVHKGGTSNTFIFIGIGDTDIRNSILSAEWDDGGGATDLHQIWFDSTANPPSLKNTYVNNFAESRYSGAPVAYENMHLHYSSIGLRLATNAVINIPGLFITGVTSKDIRLEASGMNTQIVDPAASLGTVQIDGATGTIYENYSVNINVTDKDGNALSGVTVKIEDTDSVLVSYVDSDAVISFLDPGATDCHVDDGTKFSVGDILKITMEYLEVTNIVTNTLTVVRDSETTYSPDGRYVAGEVVYKQDVVTTDANGDIPEQEVANKQWEGTSQTEKSYGTHIFTISLAGYETLILENITINAPIVWHLELQPLRARVYGRSHRIQTAQFV